MIKLSIQYSKFLNGRSTEYLIISRVFVGDEAKRFILCEVRNDSLMLIKSFDTAKECSDRALEIQRAIKSYGYTWVENGGVKQIADCDVEDEYLFDTLCERLLVITPNIAVADAILDQIKIEGKVKDFFHKKDYNTWGAWS